MAEVSKPLCTCPLTEGELSHFEEKSFLDLTTRVARHYGVLFSCLAVQSPEGIHLKARVGDLPCFLPLPASGKDLMCRHIVEKDAPIIIEDTAQCHRVSDDPLVRGYLQARFYCGMPVKKPDENNLVVGTLCLFDQVPKRLSLRCTEHLMRAASEVSALFAKISTGLPLWSVCMSSKQLAPIARERSETFHNQLSEIGGEDLSDTDSEEDFEDTATKCVSTAFSPSPAVSACREASESETDLRFLTSSPALVQDGRKSQRPTSDFEAPFRPCGSKRSYTSPETSSPRDYEIAPLKMQKRAFTDGHKLDDSQLSMVLARPEPLPVKALPVEGKYDLDTPTNALKEFLVALNAERFLPDFLKEDIDMESLLLLSEQDFISLGITMGPRRKIQAALAGMAGATIQKRQLRRGIADILQ
eukprot:TRINITY_DN8023_c0_g1_i1.p1 TRINITY_DN8023_c0_g1~~TRINITY_DN8023_c0_g1_i1.p1  ORF type:complete len:415 (+),score=62.18 TRINITY_DN8023_c0_g1_i1:68-1312(+)